MTRRTSTQSLDVLIELPAPEYPDDNITLAGIGITGGDGTNPSCRADCMSDPEAFIEEWNAIGEDLLWDIEDRPQFDGYVMLQGVLWWEESHGMDGADHDVGFEANSIIRIPAHNPPTQPEGIKPVVTIHSELTRVEADKRLDLPAAQLDNMPLALAQVSGKARASTLRWVLGLPIRRYHGDD